MVGQAARAADMRAGTVAKPGMKAMNGGGGSMSRSTQKYKAPTEEKAKPKPKGTTHSQMVAQWEANGRDADGKLIKHAPKKEAWSKEQVNAARDRAMEAQRKAQAVTMTAAEAAGEELEAAPDGVPRHLLARTRMGDLARAMQALTREEDGGSSSSSSGDEEMWALVECKRAQLEELECLEAMFLEEFLLVTSAEVVAALREQCESLGDDAASADAATLRAVAMHAPLEFSLQLTAHGERTAEEAVVPLTDEAGAEQEGGGAPSGQATGPVGPTPLVASLLLRVRFPAQYPKVAPVLSVEDAMVTTEEPLAQDKVLATQALVQETALVAAMLERAAESLPDPCMFDAASWLVENAFQFVRQGWV